MQSYYLRRVVIDDARIKVNITEKDFVALRVSMDCLVNILYIEEKYDFIVKNKIALDLALEYPDEIDRNMQSHRYAKSEINRHFANILTTTRLYVDQALRYGKKLDRLFGEPLVSFGGWFAQEYDARLGYRVMEALRNFVQHRGDAIHHASFGTYKEYIEDRKVMPQDGVQSRHQLARVERFNHVIVGASLQSGHLVAAFAPRREHQYGNIRQEADAVTQRQSIFTRQHQIQDDDVEALPGKRRAHRGAVMDRLGADAEITQIGD